MKDNQNKFYSSVSEYYSEIFPYQPVQFQFVKNRLGELSGRKILDIGCATGELAFQLANNGSEVTGIDLNEDLLNKALTNKTHQNCNFQVGNMLNLKQDFQNKKFDGVLCFGNTLVHLLSKELLQKMVEGVFSVLNKDGHFLLQILNYDFILNDKISLLPLIETDNIRFVRKYIFENDNPLIEFQTELVLKKEGKTIANETSLLALKSDELLQLLNATGFHDIELYSNFKREPFGGNHLPLVLSCKK